MKKARIAILLLGFLTSFCPGVQGQQHASSEQEQTYRERGAPPVPVQDNRPEDALVVVGVITCLVVGWQAFETRRAAEAALEAAEVAKRNLILQFRPRVFVRSVILTETDDSLSLEVIIVNKGGTEANILQGLVNLDWVYSFSPKSRVATAELGANKLMPGKQQKLAINLRDDWVMYRFSEDPRRASQMRLRCEGTIVYADSNGVARQTGFSRLRNALTNQWEVDTNPECEYQD